jgi:hypothetical protein
MRRLRSTPNHFRIHRGRKPLKRSESIREIYREHHTTVGTETKRDIYRTPKSIRRNPTIPNSRRAYRRLTAEKRPCYKERHKRAMDEKRGPRIFMIRQERQRAHERNLRTNQPDPHRLRRRANHTAYTDRAKP